MRKGAGDGAAWRWTVYALVLAVPAVAGQSAEGLSAVTLEDLSSGCHASGTADGTVAGPEGPTCASSLVQLKASARHRPTPVVQAVSSTLPHPVLHPLIDEDTRPVTIKAYFVNIEGSLARQSCMEEQLGKLRDDLRPLGFEVDFERYPAVMFDSCWGPMSCTLERPSCLAGHTWAETWHPKAEDPNSAFRGVVGNWCAHKELLRKLRRPGQAKHDYYLIFEDDAVFLPSFGQKIVNFLTRHPSFWTLVAVDTWCKHDGHHIPFNQSDEMEVTEDGTLYSISSSAENTYLGGHAWLVSGEHLAEASDLFEKNPVMPLDWVPKANRSMHVATWALQIRAVQQRRVIPPEAVSKLTPACQAEGTQSEIAGGGRTFTPGMDKSVTATLPFGDAGSAAIESTTAIGETGPLFAEDRGAARLRSATRGDPPAARERPRELLVLGMYQSGTNYVSSLVRKNLERRLLPLGTRLCRNYTAFGYCGRVWKHTHPARLPELAELRDCGHDCAAFEDFSEVVAVVVTRHPHSHMRSLQQTVYDMDCGDLHADGWLERACSYKEPSREWMVENQGGMERVPRATCASESQDEVCWKSLPEAWSSYMEGYRNLAESGLFHKVLFVRYEDVVANPLPHMARIAHAVGMKAPVVVNRVEKTQKEESDQARGLVSNGRQGAVDKLQSLDYGSQYTPEEMQALCSRIDTKLLYSFGYFDCQYVNPKWIERIYNPDIVGDYQLMLEWEKLQEERRAEADKLAGEATA